MSKGHPMSDNTLPLTGEEINALLAKHEGYHPSERSWATIGELRQAAIALTRQRAEIAAYRKAYGCIACGEDHPEGTMCPPFEVRTTGMSWNRGRLSNAVARAERAESERDTERAAREKAEGDLERAFERNRAINANYTILLFRTDALKRAVEERDQALKRIEADAKCARHFDLSDANQRSNLNQLLWSIEVRSGRALTAAKGEGEASATFDFTVPDGELGSPAAAIKRPTTPSSATIPPEGHSAGAGGELLPCPFCGGTSIEIRPNNIGDYYAICDANDPSVQSCGASTSDQACETEATAIRRWNRRATLRPDLLREAMEALEPFSQYAKRLDLETVNWLPDPCPLVADPSSQSLYPNVGDLRRARSTHSKLKAATTPNSGEK